MNKAIQTILILFIFVTLTGLPAAGASDASDAFASLGKRTSLKRKIRYAQKLYAKKDYNKALIAFRQLVKEYPEAAQGYFGAASVYFVHENFKRAASNYKAALKYEPKFSQAYEWLGNAYVKLGQMSDALAAWKKALSINPENKPLSNKVKQYTSGKKTAGGMPSLIAGKLKTAWRMHEEGYSLKAVRFLKKERDKYKKNVSIKFLLSRIYFSMMDYKAVLWYWKKISTLRGTDLNLIQFLSREDFPEYMEEVEGMISIYPDNPDVLYYAGSVYASNSDGHERALELFSRALEAGIPAKTKTMLAIGRVLKRAGRIEDAIKMYKKTIHAGNSMEAHYQLGLIYYYDKGLVSKAGYHLRVVKKAKSEYKDVYKILKQVKQGKK